MADSLKDVIARIKAEKEAKNKPEEEELDEEDKKLMEEMNEEESDEDAVKKEEVEKVLSEEQQAQQEILVLRDTGVYNRAVLVQLNSINENLNRLNIIIGKLAGEENANKQ